MDAIPLSLGVLVMFHAEVPHVRKLSSRESQFIPFHTSSSIIHPELRLNSKSKEVSTPIIKQTRIDTTLNRPSGPEPPIQASS